MTPGPRNLITDVPGLRVGQAADDERLTGVTVLTADNPFIASVHVMGGAPGTRETDLLAPGTLVEEVDALVLAGGSAFGLAAADGVMEGLRDRGRGFAAGAVRVPIVPAAILFDLGPQGTGWATTPYPALGRAALEAAGADVALGRHGAGAGATTATVAGGIGSASSRLADGTTVGALVAVNAVGTVCHPATGRFWAAPFEQGEEFGGLGQPPPAPAGLPTKLGGAGLATTLAIVATDARLDKAGARRMAMAAQDGIARAILPSHTPFDGDLVFGVSTRARPVPDPARLMALGHAGAVTLSRAIARAVWSASGSGTVPTWSDSYG